MHKEHTMANRPTRTYLKDYTPPTHSIHNVDLLFDIYEDKTVVIANLQCAKNKDNKENKDLVLVGSELVFISVELNGSLLNKDQYALSTSGLTIFNTPEEFTLKIVNEIDPANNTKLMGLYQSGGIYCSQCEAEGFRRITYFLDRPDVMSLYTTTIIADKKRFPILLSNGNCVEKGERPEGRHFAVWKDPFFKPSYLFALVAGDLGMIASSYTTKSGREIPLQIYCDKGNEDKCVYAMDSLKRAMQWDEKVFNLEYDLDIFMIVAVDAFNFGAMENKGLNIFNTNAILADQKTATDANFIRVEKVVAHEYFHNWTGNRVTLRDWFQLTLKEGLTVFRDQEFSGDMQDRTTERIEEVRTLQTLQFSEDAGPMSHSIKPESYIDIDNFYTATVYRKGAEVIRMLYCLLSKEVFFQGIKKYFELYDGKAVTTEDFIHAMELASERDLTQFKLWYSQAKTPEITISGKYIPQKKCYVLTAAQTCAKAKGEKAKKPFHIPLKLGLLSESGEPIAFSYKESEVLDSVVLELTKKTETFLLENIDSQPILSLNRDFAAPIHVYTSYSFQEKYQLMLHDTNLFNRYAISQEIWMEAIEVLVKQFQKHRDLTMSNEIVEAFGFILKDGKITPNLKAMMLSLPAETTILERQRTCDFDAVFYVREFLKKQFAEAFEKELFDLYQDMQDGEEFSLKPEFMGRRSLKNIALSYLIKTYKNNYIDLAYKQFASANNMTDQYGAILYLSQGDSPIKDRALEEFYALWNQDLLTLGKWFTVQAASPSLNALECVRKLSQHDKFDRRSPNLVRSLFGVFMHNYIRFHDKSGAAYRFVIDEIIALEKLNPSVAARLTLGFKDYGRLDKQRKSLMKQELLRLKQQPNLAKGVFEVVDKILAS